MQRILQASMISVFVAVRMAVGQDSLAVRFAEPLRSARGLAVVLPMKDVSADALIKELEQWYVLGVDGVMLRLAGTADEMTWAALVNVAERCGTLNMEMGIQDFRAEGEMSDVDIFDESQVFRHLNQRLFELQRRLKGHYGTTLTWYQFPRLAVEAEKGRPQVEAMVADAWRDRFAETVRDLVHEAGLDAGLPVDGIPIVPEEAACYFHRVIVTSHAADDVRQRGLNQRAAGGARVGANRWIVGEIPVATNRGTLVTSLLPFHFKAEADRLFCEGATRLLIVPQQEQWTVARCDEYRAACQYVKRCQLLFSQSQPLSERLILGDVDADTLNGYAYDWVSLRQLQAAQVKEGCLLFGSGRTYRTLRVGVSAWTDKKVENMLRRFATAGVTIEFVEPDGLSEEERVRLTYLTSGETPVGKRVAGKSGIGMPDIDWLHGDVGIRIQATCRRTEHECIYFIANGSAVNGEVTLRFRDARGIPEIWNPEDGTIGELKPVTRSDDGRWSVRLYVEPFDAFFIVFRLQEQPRERSGKQAVDAQTPEISATQ